MRRLAGKGAVWLVFGLIHAEGIGAAELDIPSLDEVVVTATHRPTLLRETPSAITVLGGEELTLSRSRDIPSLVGQVPGLSAVDSGPSNLRLVMRGGQGNGEALAGLYFDEIPITGSVGATNDAGGSTPSLGLYDVERVEVLRGPQGTLYGANAMSGAVKVLYARPTGNFEGEGHADLLARSHGRGANRLQGMVNVPLIADRFASRLVIYREDGGGYIDNGFRDARNVNDADRLGGRAMLRWTPAQGIAVDGAFYFQDELGEQPIWVREAGDFEDNIPSRRTNRDKLRVYALTASWDLKAFLATAIASRTERSFDQVSADPSAFFSTNLDNPAVCERLRGGGAPCNPDAQDAFNDYVRSFIPNVLLPRQDTGTNNLEIRIASQAERSLAWTGGIFLSRRKSDLDNLQLDVDPGSGLVIAGNPARFERRVHDELEQAAGYFNLSWTATPDLTLEAGTRRFHYRRVVDGQTITGLDLIGSPPSPFATNRDSESGWVSRFSASYRLSAGLYAYAQVARGYRPGGVNQVIGLPDALVPYRPDSLWNYEAGLKAQALDGRIQLNSSAYHVRWGDLQVTGSRPDGLFRFVSNAGAATVSGIELELQARAAPGLHLRGNLSALRAKLSEDQLNDNVVAAGRKGDRIPYTPSFTAGLSAEYRQSLGSSFSGLFSLNGRYVGGSYSEFRPTNTFRRRLPAYTLVGAQLGVEANTGRWAAYLFVDNVLDDTAILSASATAVTLGQTQAVSAPPRTIGASLRLRF